MQGYRAAGNAGTQQCSNGIPSQTTTPAHPMPVSTPKLPPVLLEGSEEPRMSESIPWKHSSKPFLWKLEKKKPNSLKLGWRLPSANQSPFLGVQMPSNVRRRPLLGSFSSLIGPRRNFICTMRRPQPCSAGCTGVSPGLFNLRLWESVLKPGLQGV